jgi:threonine dehydrogenase-like Zn-dependent dehydrogenase
VREHGKGAALFGYTKLYGHVPGAQAEYLRVPQAQFGPVRVPDGPPDERFLFLSDVLPTAWQAVVFTDVPPGGSLAVLGLGPIGQMACRVARHQGVERIIGVDLVPERLAMAERHGAEALDSRGATDVAEALRDRTGGRGPDAVIDAVGMEAHGAPVAGAMQRAAAALPRAVSEPLATRVGVDRLTALRTAIAAVRRGGTLSIAGVYGGAADPLPMLDLFDKGIQIRMGQAHVRRWVPEILPLLQREDDVFGLDDFVTHRLPLEDAPQAYAKFQAKQDGAIKIVLAP